MTDIKTRAVMAQQLQTQDIGKTVTFTDDSITLTGELQALSGARGQTMHSYSKVGLRSDFVVTVELGGVERELSGTLTVVIDDGE